MKMKSRHRKVLVEIICLLFIILFVYAAVSKLLDWNKFYIDLKNSPILGSTVVANLASWFIPIIELIVVGLIVWPKTKLKGLYGALVLMSIFTLYIGGILLFSSNIPCSCGGVLEKLGWTEHLIFNIGFILLALAGILSHRKTIQPII